MYNENNGIHGYRIMHFYLTKLGYQIIFLTTYRYIKKLNIKSIVRERKVEQMCSKYSSFARRTFEEAIEAWQSIDTAKLVLHK